MPAIKKPKRKAAASKKKASGSKGKASASGGRVDAEKKTETKTTKSGPYDAAFEQCLIDHNIFPMGHNYPNGGLPPEPKNWNEIQEHLARRRSSLSPSRFPDEEHKHFVYKEAGAFNEKQVSELVLPIVQGTVEDTRTQMGGIRFANLKTITADNTVPGNPDVYYGARPGEIKQGVRDAIEDLIIPSTNHHYPAAPNFLLACKGPTGTKAVALRQVLYDGAICARGIQALRSFQGEDVYDGNAYCISSLFYGGMLGMYTIHPVKNGGSVQYVMSQIGFWAIIGNPGAFREGVGAFRNLREWAKEQRDSAIQIANGRVL